MKQSLNYFLLVVILLITFLIGGSLQFFLGLSNTLTTLLLVLLLLVSYVLNASQAGKVIFDRPVQVCIVLALYILVNGIVNGTYWLLSFLYALLFCFLPLSIYTAVKWNRKRHYTFIFYKLFPVVVLVQMPVLYIQNSFYSTLLNIKRSSQFIEPVDMNFGTFFMKNDHALGFFLISFVLFLWLDRTHFSYVKKVFFSLYSVGALLLTNSKISYLLMGVALGYILYKHIRQRKLILYAALLFIALGLLFNESIREIDQVQRIEQEVEYKLNLERSRRGYKAKEANRYQTIVVFWHDKVRIVGEGPFTYFNILTGKFDHNPNFSQWLWFYYDLGVVGLFVFAWFLLWYRWSRMLPQAAPYASLLLLFLTVYALFTNVTADLAFVLTYILFSHDKSDMTYGSYSSALS